MIAAAPHPVVTTAMEDAMIAVAEAMMIADAMTAITVEALIATATTTVAAARQDATEARHLAASAAHRDMTRWCVGLLRSWKQRTRWQKAEENAPQLSSYWIVVTPARRHAQTNDMLCY